MHSVWKHQLGNTDSYRMSGNTSWGTQTYTECLQTLAGTQRLIKNVWKHAGGHRLIQNFQKHAGGQRLLQNVWKYWLGDVDSCRMSGNTSWNTFALALVFTNITKYTYTYITSGTVGKDTSSHGKLENNSWTTEHVIFKSTSMDTTAISLQCFKALTRTRKHMQIT